MIAELREFPAFLGVRADAGAREIERQKFLGAVRHRGFDGQPFHRRGANYAALNNDPAQRLSFMRTGGPGSFHSIAELDARLDAIDAEPDPVRRERLIADTLRFMDDEAYVLSLWNVNAVYGKRRDLHWAPPPDVVMPIFSSLEWAAE